MTRHSNDSKSAGCSYIIFPAPSVYKRAYTAINWDQVRKDGRLSSAATYTRRGGPLDYTNLRTFRRRFAADAIYIILYYYIRGQSLHVSPGKHRRNNSVHSRRCIRTRAFIFFSFFFFSGYEK